MVEAYRVIRANQLDDVKERGLIAREHGLSYERAMNKLGVNLVADGAVDMMQSMLVEDIVSEIADEILADECIENLSRDLVEEKVTDDKLVEDIVLLKINTLNIQLGQDKLFDNSCSKLIEDKVDLKDIRVIGKVDSIDYREFKEDIVSAIMDKLLYEE